MNTNSLNHDTGVFITIDGEAVKLPSLRRQDAIHPEDDIHPEVFEVEELQLPSLRRQDAIHPEDDMVEYMKYKKEVSSQGLTPIDLDDWIIAGYNTDYTVPVPLERHSAEYEMI